MLTLGLIIIILTNALALKKENSMLYSRSSIIILIYSIFISLNNLYYNSISKGIGLYGDLYHVTTITQIFHIFIFILCIIILHLTSFFPIKIVYNKECEIEINKNNKKNLKLSIYLNKYNKQLFKITEYPIILLFIILGAMLIISTSDIISIFLSIELQSYGLYLLSTLYKNSELATSGGLTYFLLGSLSSCFILLSTSILYVNTGTSNLDSIYIIMNISDILNNDTTVFFWYKPYYINISLLIMSVGFLFKVSAAPFHFWSPDVYDAIPTIITTFVAIIAKISIFIFLLELVHYTSKYLFLFNNSWTISLLLSSLLSLIIGTVVGLTQFRIKRLYAYSTISHIGFILLALCINTIESIQAFIFYILQYSISNLNAFLILLAIGFMDFKYKNLNDRENSPIQIISEIKSYFYINPTIALSLSITLFSFIGIPPLIGFFAKQMVLSAALDNGYIFMCLIAILTSVISAVYYLAIIKEIYFFKPEFENISLKTFYWLSDKRPSVFKGKEKKILSSYLTISISIITLLILMYIFIYDQVYNMSNIVTLLLFNK